MRYDAMHVSEHVYVWVCGCVVFLRAEEAEVINYDFLNLEILLSTSSGRKSNRWNLHARKLPVLLYILFISMKKLKI